MNSNKTYEIDKCGRLTLIIGGAYQGKLTYAVQRLGFNAAAVLDLAAAQCPEANVFDSVIGGNSSVYIHFEALTQKIAAEYALTRQSNGLTMIFLHRCSHCPKKNGLHSLRAKSAAALFLSPRRTAFGASCTAPPLQRLRQKQTA